MSRVKAPAGVSLGNRLVFLSLAALIGAVVGAATLLLIELILKVQWLGFGQASETHFASIAASVPWWRLVAVTTLGGLAVGFLMIWLPDRRYHGIADVMEACALKSARMPTRSGLVAALAAGVSLGSGAPLGREGPAVHIGASISAWLAERLGLDQKQSLALLGCGAAAAVTVSFSTPVAAVIFALEVIVGYYTLRVFAPVVIASLVAMVVRDTALGSEPLFPVPHYELASLWELPLFALLGILGAGVARLLLFMVARVQAAWLQSSLPKVLRPACAGFAIGCLGVWLPGILSLGYQATLEAYTGSLAISMLVALLLAKLVAVSLAIGSGFAGGIFGPAVFLGAMLGGCYWFLLSLLPIPLADSGAYAMVGPAAVASALLGAPISTIIIVFEFTHDYGVTLGVMTATAFASTVMQLSDNPSFFRWQLAQRSVNISSGRDISLLMTHSVSPLLSDQYLVVPADAVVSDVEGRLGMSRQRVAILVDENEKMVGSITLRELVGQAIEVGGDVPVLDAATSSEYHIMPSTNIVTALNVMAEQQLHYVPVIHDRGESSGCCAGIVQKSDLLAEHYDVVKRAREDEFGIT